MQAYEDIDWSVTSEIFQSWSDYKLLVQLSLYLPFIPDPVQRGTVALLLNIMADRLESRYDGIAEVLEPIDEPNLP